MRCVSLSSMLNAAGILVGLVACAGTQSPNLTPESNQKVVDNIPEWFLNPPTDSSYLFSTTTATSRDLQMASDKAKAGARADLAQQLSTRMANLTKNFQDEVGVGDDSEFLQQFTSATKTVTDQTLNGSRIDQQKILAESGIFRAYVLMSLPIGDANRKLMETLQENENLFTRFKATEAFEELEKEIKALGNK